MACAAALASLDLFDQTRLLEHIQESARIIQRELDQLRDCPFVLDVRQRGIMVGIELSRGGSQPSDTLQPSAEALCMAMREHGLILRHLGNVVVLMPISAMDHETLGNMLDVVVQTIGAAHKSWERHPVV